MTSRIVIVLEALLVLLVVALLALSLASGRWSALAQNAPITNAPGLIIPKDQLPDLVPVAATMNLACAADKKSLTATFTTTIQNKGKTSADLSMITWHIIVDAIAEPTQDVFVEPSPLKPIHPAQGGPKILKPGATFKTNLTIHNVPHLKKSAPASARYALVVRADPTQGVAEADENNNYATKFFKDPCPL